jgi:hypothetical protein
MAVLKMMLVQSCLFTGLLKFIKPSELFFDQALFFIPGDTKAR